MSSYYVVTAARGRGTHVSRKRPHGGLTTAFAYAWARWSGQPDTLCGLTVKGLQSATREGMQIARQNGKLRGKQPRLKPAQDREIRRMHDSGDYNIAEIAALFSVSRPTVYRSLDRTAELPPLPAGTRPVPEVAGYDQVLIRRPG